MEVPRERKRVRDPDARINELGPRGLDHGLELRASARSRFGDFRATEAEVLPAGSAQLPMLSLSGCIAGSPDTNWGVLGSSPTIAKRAAPCLNE